MNAHSPHQTRWRWFARCLALGVAATCFAAPASQAEPSEMPSEVGLRAEGLIAGKLRSIVIPELRLVDATLEEAIDFLRTRVFELDPDPDPQARGVNIVIQPGATDQAPRINLNVRKIPVDEALRYITDLAGLTYQIDAFAVIVGPPTLGRNLHTRRFPVKLDSLKTVLPEIIAHVEGDSAFFDRETSTLIVRTTLAEIEWLDAILGGRDDETLHTRRFRVPPIFHVQAQIDTAEDILAAQGMIFGEGASACFDRETSTLVVRNTLAQLALMEAIVKALGTGRR